MPDFDLIIISTDLTILLYSVFQETEEQYQSPLPQPFSIPFLTAWSAILGLTDLSDEYSLINHLILIYEFYIYNSRNRILTMSIWKRLLIKLKALRKETANINLKKDTSILRNGILSLRTLFKWCNGGGGGAGYTFW